jgi:hypothetical protein
MKEICQLSVRVISLQSLDQDYNTLINVLEKESSILIEWFNFNCMQAQRTKIEIRQYKRMKNCYLIKLR